MDARTHFGTLARYNGWANARLLDAVARLRDRDYHLDVGLFFRSVHGTLNHLLVAEHGLWFRRFSEGISARVALDEEAEPDRERLADALRVGAARWLPLVQGWPPERFEGVLDYTSTRGERATLPFAPTLAHVFNHGTHHRGQITAAMTLLGQPAPELDLLYMLQEEKDQP